MKAPALSLLFAGALALTTGGLLNHAYAQIVNEADAAAPKGGGGSNKGGGGGGGGERGNRGGGDRGGDRGGEVRNFSGGPGPGNAKAPQQTFRTEGRDNTNRSEVNRDFTNLNNRPDNPPRYQVNRPNFDNDRRDGDRNDRDRDRDRDRNDRSNWDRYGNWGGHDGDWHRDNDWRYRWYGDRWWFWLPTGRWAYWYGDRWNDYYYDAPTTVYNTTPTDNQWRYKYVNGIWWYYLPNGRWVFWMNGQWSEAPPAPMG